MPAFDLTTKPGLKKFNELLSAHLESFAKEHGLTFQAAGGSFDGLGKYTCKTVFMQGSNGASPRDVQCARDYDLWQQVYSDTWPTADKIIGTTVKLGGKTYTVKGAKAPTRTKPASIVVETADGKGYLYSHEVFMPLWRNQNPGE
jgi:hypothetical protein